MLEGESLEQTYAQSPLGGCVLKHVISSNMGGFRVQSPLGGCVLKPYKTVVLLMLIASRL